MSLTRSEDALVAVMDTPWQRQWAASGGRCFGFALLFSLSIHLALMGAWTRTAGDEAIAAVPEATLQVKMVVSGSEPATLEIQEQASPLEPIPASASRSWLRPALQSLTSVRLRSGLEPLARPALPRRVPDLVRPSGELFDASAPPTPSSLEHDGSTVIVERISAHMQRFQRYPRAALRVGLQGEVWLAFELGRDGWARSPRVERSSGHAVLDRAALALLTRSQPLPVPEAVDRLSVRVPIRYRLNRVPDALGLRP